MDIRFECPKCSQSMEMDESGAGRQIFCPSCGQRLVVPDRNTPAPVPAKYIRESVSSYDVLPRETITKRLSEMDWFQFEKLMAMIFSSQDYQVTRRGGAKADGGIDLIVEKDGKRVAVQCKHWKSWKVGVRNIRELKGALSIESLDSGVLVTIVGYTQEALELGKKQGIVLFDQGRVLDLIDQAGLRNNPEFAKNLNDETRYCPKCDVAMVLRTAEKGARRGSKFWGCPNYPRCHYLINI